MVVIAIIALLAGMILPALSKAKAKAQGIYCMANGKQLILAWQMYASDQDDRLASNPEWVPGWLDWGLRPDNTNTLYLTGPEALLSLYTAQNVAIFKCPADNLLSGAQRMAGWSKRVRSMSMNFTLGSPRDSLTGYGAKGLTRLSALEQPTLTWVFVDEHPDSINNGFFTVWLDQQYWQDLPASSHNGACGFAFADGHSEIKKWRAASTRKPVRYVDYRDWENEPIKHSEQGDHVWLQERTGARN
jgi:prepilin-type processing-associated H-X9-DG protein